MCMLVMAVEGLEKNRRAQVVMFCKLICNTCFRGFGRHDREVGHFKRKYLSLHFLFSSHHKGNRVLHVNTFSITQLTS